MKRIATAAFAVCLMAGASALAQPSDDHHHDQGGGGAPHAGGPSGGAPHTGGPPTGAGPTGGTHTAGPNTAGPTHTGGPTNSPNFVTGGAPTTGGPNNHTGGPNYRTGGPNYRTGGPNYRPGGPGAGGPNFRPGVQRPQYSTHAFPHVFRPQQRFNWRGGHWSGPSGFYYRHWGYGQILPFGWFTSEWYINDYWDYGLSDPPYGYEWIRNGPDALLVNIYTGMVVEDVPSLFY